MVVCNKNGVPLWAIRRMLIWHISLYKAPVRFYIALDSSILFHGQHESHIDLVYYNPAQQQYCIPLAN